MLGTPETKVVWRRSAGGYLNERICVCCGEKSGGNTRNLEVSGLGNESLFKRHPSIKKIGKSYGKGVVKGALSMSSPSIRVKTIEVRKGASVSLSRTLKVTS